MAENFVRKIVLKLSGTK